MANALLVVDVQNDFCEGGSLAVEGGIAIAESISEYIADNETKYDYIIASKDWHIEPGEHFSATPDYIDSWPPHCRAETHGANLQDALDEESFDAVFLKGQYSAAYSAFEGTLAADDSVNKDENGHDIASAEAKVSLNDWLQERDVIDLTLVGIATDYCVKASAIDAVQAGFDTTVLLDLTVGISEQGVQEAIEQMQDLSIEVEEA